MALKSTQILAGEKMNMHQTVSGWYSFSISNFWGVREFSFTMPSGYHFCKLDVYGDPTLQDGSLPTQNINRPSFAWYMLPQDGSGVVKVRFAVSPGIKDATIAGGGTVRVRFMAFSDAEGSWQ